MNNYIIVYFNNFTGHMVNLTYRNCSKSEAVKLFRADYDESCVLVNIIEL